MQEERSSLSDPQDGERLQFGRNDRLRGCKFSFSFALYIYDEYIMWLNLITANTCRLDNAVLMLAHRLRRSTSFKPAMYQRPVSAGTHNAFVLHLSNVGPTSSTLVQHWINVIQMFCVYWVEVR